jgi:hypothetical protein
MEKRKDRGAGCNNGAPAGALEIQKGSIVSQADRPDEHVAPSLRKLRSPFMPMRV